ncbi:MAG TPA: cupredoxin domain-containing protein [Sphingomicrobium sp.]
MRTALAFGILACTPVAAVSAQPASVAVQLSSFKFAPSTIALKAGQPVTLHLQNASGSGHNFSAPQFFAAAKVDPGSASLIHNGTVELKGHQSVDISLVPAAGNYPLKCSHSLHSAFGMKGRITVG